MALSPVIVVMGVSGCGKSTIGTMLAQTRGYEFADGDWLHPKTNVEKMASGKPLTDDDRAPWLAAIAQWIDDHRNAGKPAVITCSALRRRYRDVLIGDRNDVPLVYLKGDAALIAQRLAARQDHFMPASLLRSQFEALEEPAADERPIVVSIAPSPPEIVSMIVGALDSRL